VAVGDLALFNLLPVLQIMRNTLYKAYLDDFAAFCNKLGGTTGDDPLQPAGQEWVPLWGRGGACKPMHSTRASVRVMSMVQLVGGMVLVRLLPCWQNCPIVLS
jgi:hypothetical protein